MSAGRNQAHRPIDPVTTLVWLALGGATLAFWAAVAIVAFGLLAG